MRTVPLSVTDRMLLPCGLRHQGAARNPDDPVRVGVDVGTVRVVPLLEREKVSDRVETALPVDGAGLREPPCGRAQTVAGGHLAAEAEDDGDPPAARVDVMQSEHTELVDHRGQTGGDAFGPALLPRGVGGDGAGGTEAGGVSAHAGRARTGSAPAGLGDQDTPGVGVPGEPARGHQVLGDHVEPSADPGLRGGAGHQSAEHGGGERGGAQTAQHQSPLGVIVGMGPVVRRALQVSRRVESVASRSV